MQPRGSAQQTPAVQRETMEQVQRLDWLILATFCTADASHSDPCEESGPCGSRNMIGERVADLGSGVII